MSTTLTGRRNIPKAVSACAHRFSRRLHKRREGRKEYRKDVRNVMKESVRNSRRGLAHYMVGGPWPGVPLDRMHRRGIRRAPVESDEAVEPAPSEHGDWQVPGLVDRSGAPIEVPTPVRPRAGPWTSRTSGQIRIRTHTTTQQPSGRPWTRPNRVTRSCCRPARMTCAPLTHPTSRRTSCCAAAWTCAARARRAPCC